MTSAKTEVEMMLPLDQVAMICDVTPQQLRDWVADRVVEPDRRGGKGRGQHHYFKVQKVLGLMVAIWLWESPQGTRSEYFTERVADYSSWSWSAFAHFMAISKDEWSEEEYVKVMQPRQLPGQKVHPDEEKNILRLAKSIMKFREVLVEQLERNAQSRSKVKR